MSRTYPYKVTATNPDLLKVIERDRHIVNRYRVISNGKNSLSDEFMEYARQTFSDKWKVRLLDHRVLQGTGACAYATWEFKFRSKDDALLFKLMA